MYRGKYCILDRLIQIQESIDIVEGRCKHIHTSDDFLMNADRMMVFDSCVMRLQAIGEQVGKLLKEKESPLSDYPQIPWRAIYDMRNFISHEYANIDETIVFSTIKEDLPAIKPLIEEMIERYKQAK